MERNIDISQTIHMLGDLLGRAVPDLESPAVFEIEEHIRAEAKARRGLNLILKIYLTPNGCFFSPFACQIQLTLVYCQPL